MNDGLTIDNGGRTNQPIATLRAYNGNMIDLYERSIPAIVEWIDKLVGPMPMKPPLCRGGSMTPDGTYTQLSDGMGGMMNVPHLTYEPSGDVRNQVEAQNYATALNGWLAMKKDYFQQAAAIVGGKIGIGSPDS